MKKIFIIILKFNGEEKIKRCLASLALAELPFGWQKQVLLVDNSKSQKLKVKSQNYNLKVKTIINNKNLGFAGGMNVGIKYALKNGAEAVLLLNQDTVVEKNFLPPLLENPADIVSALIKFRRQEKWVYDFGGKINWWLGKAKHRECSNVQMFKCSKNYLHWWLEGIPPRWEKIDYVSGCAMLVRRPVFEKIGFFDERYFLYFEDVDFCLRAKSAGFKIAVEPKSVVIHFLKEGKRKPLWQRWQIIKSNLIFINRWIKWPRRPLAWIFCLGRGIKILIK